MSEAAGTVNFDVLRVAAAVALLVTFALVLGRALHRHALSRQSGLLRALEQRVELARGIQYVVANARRMLVGSPGRSSQLVTEFDQDDECGATAPPLPKAGAGRNRSRSGGRMVSRLRRGRSRG